MGTEQIEVRPWARRPQRFVVARDPRLSFYARMRDAAQRSATFLLCVTALLVVAAGANAQSIVAPSSHWGAQMYPSLSPSQTIGFNVALYSEFGKDLDANGDPVAPGMGTRNPYGTPHETLGFNVLSASNTRPLRHERVFSTNFLYTATLTVGVVGDRLTEWLQNDVIHDTLNYKHVPREKVVDCSNDYRCAVLGYSGELNYRVFSQGQRRDGFKYLSTPLFFGAGASLSTIQNEIYSQLGMRRFDPLHVGKGTVRVTVSGMARGGVVAPSLIFQDSSGVYLTSQASLALHTLEQRFPIILEGTVSGTTGTFITHRRVNEGGDPPLSLRETFVSVALELGGFRFETFNDLIAGKDKGPTFGAAIYYTAWQDSRLSRWIGWL